MLQINMMSLRHALPSRVIRSNKIYTSSKFCGTANLVLGMQLAFHVSISLLQIAIVFKQLLKPNAEIVSARLWKLSNVCLTRLCTILRKYNLKDEHLGVRCASELAPMILLLIKRLAFISMGEKLLAANSHQSSSHIRNRCLSASSSLPKTCEEKH